MPVVLNLDCLCNIGLKQVLVNTGHAPNIVARQHTSSKRMNTTATSGCNER